MLEVCVGLLQMLIAPSFPVIAVIVWVLLVFKLIFVVFRCGACQNCYRAALFGTVCAVSQCFYLCLTDDAQVQEEEHSQSNAEAGLQSVW